MSHTLNYSVVDVFAERALEGNALAIFHDARGLSDDEMQALARETNLAETTFIFPGDTEIEAREGVRVRIFTTEEELPFAGHPTLGTATWLYFNHPVLRGADVITLRLNVGPITVRFDAPDEGVPGVRSTMLQNDPVFGATHDRAAVAHAIGLSEDDLSAEYLPQTVSTGVPFCIVLLRSLEVSQRLQIAQRDAQAWLDSSGAHFFYCIAPTAAKGEGEPRWHARMQFYSGEDPATGSAAGCCIAWLVKVGLVGSEMEVVIEQGIEIRRPSRIRVQARLEEGGVTGVLVSGRTIPVAEGRVFLP
ncbi:MAG TPA: PhzF family phenazine biosynthesis protein [Acidobacteriaceae bacterium]